MQVSIYCPYCHKHTALSVAQTEYSSSYGGRNYTPATWNDKKGGFWWIGICNSCHKPVLSKNEGEEIYPYPLPFPSDSRIPNPMLKDLTESKLCLSIKAFRGCAVMARRAMQNACIEKGAIKKNLVDQIKELHSNGVITKDLKEWADVVRWIGNDAAHPGVDDVEKEDAEDILNLAEQFLQVLYVAPAIAKSRRALRKK